MLLTYKALDTTELGPVTPADVLVRVDGDLQVFDDDQLLWSEPGLPCRRAGSGARGVDRAAREDGLCLQLDVLRRGRNVDVQGTCGRGGGSGPCSTTRP